MTKGFEKYFPLPWEVKIIDTATFIQSVFEPRCHVVEFNADNMAHIAALEYMVNCANLMPEAVELLKAAQETMNEACEVCAEDLGERCAQCDREKIDRRITALLAKLEGGADDATNP